MIKDNNEFDDLDNFFKENLQKINPTFEESAWEAMEVKLDSLPKAKIASKIYQIHRRNLMMMVACFVFLCWISVFALMQNRTEFQQEISIANVLKEKKSKEKKSDLSTQNLSNENNFTIQNSNRANQKNNSSKPKPTNEQNNDILKSNSFAQKQNKSLESKSNLIKREDNKYVFSQIAIEKDLLQPAIIEKIGSMPLEIALKNPVFEGYFAEKRIDTKTTLPEKPFESNRSWSMGLAFSPEINHLQFAENNTFALNTGLLLEKKIKRKWSLGLGFLFSRKKYDKTFDTDKEFNANRGESATVYPSFAPQLIQQSFKEIHTRNQLDLIELPLEVKFYAISNPKSSFFVGTGISTFLIFQEAYQLTAEPAISWDNFNNDFYLEKSDKSIKLELATLNFNMGFEQAINEKISWQIQPYYHIPLRDISLNEVRISSLGLRTALLCKLNQNK